MLNKVVLIGRLTKDPEVKSTGSGVSVATFTLAVSRRYTNQQGEREADFIPIVAWRQLADTIGKYLTKGRLVAVSGSIQTRTYDTPEGQRRYMTEVVADEVQFLERPNTGSGNERQDQEFPTPPPAYSENKRSSGGTTGVFMPMDHEDDELPF
jgi:single-strand DNA-binding protein